MNTHDHLLDDFREEAEELRTVLARTRAAHANLIAAVRAALAADAEDEPDPLFYLRDEMGSRGVR